MKDTLDIVLQNVGITVVVGSWLPCEVDEYLENNGWRWGDTETGYCIDDMSYAKYYSDGYPGITLYLGWCGWDGRMELVAEKMEA